MIDESSSKGDYAFDEQWKFECEKLFSYVTAQLLVSSKPLTIIGDICRKTMELLNCDLFFTYLINETRNSLQLHSFAGIPEAQTQSIIHLQYDTTICGYAALECQPIILRSIPLRSDSRIESLKAYGLTAYACYPMKVGRQLLGTISFGSCSRMAFGPDELEVMEKVTTYIAIAIEKDFSHARLSASKERYRVLAQRLNETDMVESEGTFSKTFYSSPTMMAITSMEDRRYIDVNKAWQDALGFSRTEAIGSTSAKLNLYVIPEQRDEVYKYLSDSDRYSNVEVKLRTKTGDILTCISSAEAIMLGGERCMLTNRINVTKRKLMEEQLRLNQERLEALQAINQMTSATTGEIAKYAYQAALKLTQSEIGCLEFINENDSKRKVYTWPNKITAQCGMLETKDDFLIDRSGLLAEAIRQRCPIVVNDYVSPRNPNMALAQDSKRVTRFLAVPIFDGDKIVSVISVINKKKDYDDSDIQQLRLLIEGVWGVIRLRKEQEALRLSEERFFKAFQSSPLMMAMINMQDEKFIAVNHKYLEIMEYKREEVMGHTTAELDIYVDKEHTSRLINEMIAKGNIKFDGHLIRTKSGKIITISGTVVAVHINKIDCRLVAVQDISAKKETEANIARLDRLNLIGEMAASMGHEIRNPMTTVRGFLQLLNEQECYAKDEAYFKIMIEELDRANDIISEYLNLAKNKIVDLQPESLDQVVRSIYPMIQADANYHEIDVILKLGNPPMPLIDAKEVRQMILNMTRNGLEAMLPGGKLTIGTTTEGNEIILFIKDEGSGLDTTIIDKLGTPFVTTKDKGTGLGLAVCYSIAARHNARIDFETGVEGTTFKVCFPMPAEPHGEG